MGQALPKHHWHEADRFLVAAQLHVPEEAREAGYAPRQQQQQQQQQQQHHQHDQQQHGHHHHHHHHHSRRRHSDSFGLGLTTPTTRPSALSSPSTASFTTSTASTTASSSASPSPSSSDVDDDEDDDDDDDDDSADSTAPPLFTSLPPAEARAIAAAQWVHVVQLARGFERVYARALEAWTCATPPATERPAASSHRRGASRIVRSTSKSSASSGNWTTMKRGRGHVSDGSRGSSGSGGTLGSSGSSSSGGGVGVEDGEGSAAALRAVEQEKSGKNEREGEEKRVSSDIVVGARRFLRVHAHTERRTDVRSWTAADLIDLATRGGPLRCYRWHSDGVRREGKERSKRQLTEDAAKLGWCGRMVVSNFQDPTTAPDGTSATAEVAKVRKDEEATVDEETGVYSITVRLPTTTVHNHALSATVLRENTTTSVPNNQTKNSLPHTILTITPACLLFIKLLTILYPTGPPWSTPASNDDFDAPPAQPSAAKVPEENIAHNRRVWIAMSLGWAWALQAYLAAHPSRQPSAADHNNDGMHDDHEDHASFDTLNAEEYLLEDDDDLLDEDDEDEWQAQLEDMSEVDIDDEDVLAALARVQLGGGGSTGGGQRRASLVPSDGEDEDELSEESEGEG